MRVMTATTMPTMLLLLTKLLATTRRMATKGAVKTK